MARIRSLKPDFFKDEKISDLSFEYRLLFQGLWLLADREGRFEDRPKYIKVEVFPYDNVDVEAGLEALNSVGLIVRYKIEGKNYIAIKNFLKHQRPNTREPKSEIPAYAKQCSARARTRTLKGKGREIEGKGKGRGKEGEGKGRENTLVEQARPDEVGQIFTYWQEVHNHPNSQLDRKRRKAIEGRLDEGYTLARIQQAIVGIKNSPHHMGQNDRNTVFDDIELICRSGANIDRFADMENQKPQINLNRYKNMTISDNPTIPEKG